MPPSVTVTHPSNVTHISRAGPSPQTTLARGPNPHQDIFTPPRPSHAKRIRGHVRRYAELKAQLADRVRAVQQLAAENEALRGRARVMELVVAARDEQMGLLAAAAAQPQAGQQVGAADMGKGDTGF